VENAPFLARLSAAVGITSAVVVALAVVVSFVLSFAASLTWSAIDAAPLSAQPQIPDFPAPDTPDPEPSDDDNTGLNDSFIDNSNVGTDGTDQTDDDNLISIDIGNPQGTGSDSVVLLVGLGLLSISPSLVLMLSSFTRIVIVFSLTRNALGLQGIPPNQVLIGLALFLSLFVMAPTIQALNEDAITPYLEGEIDQSEAIERAREPVRTFMLAHTHADELEVMLDASREPAPANPDEISLTVLIPAFMLSELKTAFIIGFVIFIPFLIIDIVVAASLMALGMMMLPPAFISLPFKLLLFIMVGGWSLIVETLLASYL
jgi:flagellar biosynthetic protein FliP